MSTIKFDNNYLPKRMNIILYTKTNKSIRIAYTPQMSIPTTSSKFVNFNPLIKINKNILSREYKINLNEKKALNENIIDVFFNKQKFNDFLNLILDKTGKKELNIQDSCTEKVIDNNIKTTLDILFKPGNVLEINKKKYTIFNYSWLDGDWLIYSDDIKKGDEEQNQQTYYHRRHYDNEESEHTITKKAFDKLNKVIPDCLKGTTIGNSLLITGDKQISEEQKKTDEIVTENKITNTSRIDKFFENKDIYDLSENNDYLPYNLTYNIPSFLKDPISVSLFYVEYDFTKEITNYKKLGKTFSDLEEKKTKLAELEKTIFKNTGSIEQKEKITEQLNKRKDKITQNNNNLTKLKENKQKLNKSLTNYKSRTLNLCGYSINSELEQILFNINSGSFEISSNIIKIDNDINNCTRNYSSHMYKNNKSETINQFNKVITLIDEKIQVFDKKRIEYTSEMNLSEFEELLRKSTDIPNYINTKKTYLDLCKTTLENILKKIDMENDYILSFITFYKQLYTYKKNQLNSTYRLTSDQKWLLTMINQIILFDLIIYNTIYNSPEYKQIVIDTKKSINDYIEKIKKLQTIRYNIKDEEINKSKDLPILSSYKYIIYYVNYVINMNIWVIFSNKTLELYNKGLFLPTSASPTTASTAR